MRPTRVYIAAPWIERPRAVAAAARLRESHIEVTSRWHDIHGDSHDPVVLKREAQHDWDDIRSADALLLLNLSKSEGKAVEQGIALEHGIPIVAIGDRTNVFHYLDGQYTFVDTIGQAIDALPYFEPRT